MPESLSRERKIIGAPFALRGGADRNAYLSVGPAAEKPHSSRRHFRATGRSSASSWSDRELPLGVTGGGLAQRGMFQHWLSKQTLCRCECEPLECQNRTTAAFYRSRMMLCVVRRCPSMSILDPPIDLQHGLIIHPGSPPSASPAMAHSISRALLDPRLARRRRFDAMSLTRPRR
jgi:hypothetical protein